MPAPQVTPETQEKEQNKLQQKVTAPMLLSLLIVFGTGAVLKPLIRQFFQTNRVNGQIQELLQVPAFSALKQADPLFYNQLEREVETSLSAGEPAEKQKEIITTALGKTFPKYVAQASDDALLSWTQSFQKLLQDPQACKSQIETGSLSADNAQMDQEIMAGMSRIIESGASGQQPPALDPNQLQQSLATVQTNIKSLHGDRVALLENNQTMKQDSQKSCAILNDFYTEVTKLPKPEAGALLRQLLGKQSAS